METATDRHSPCSPGSQDKTDDGSNMTLHAPVPSTEERQRVQSSQPQPQRQKAATPVGVLGSADSLRRRTPSVASSWSANSDRQLGHGASPDLSDRVYPIRSVVSVDPNGRTSGEHDYFPKMPDHGHFVAPRPATYRMDTHAATGVRRTDTMSQPATSTVTSPTDGINAAQSRRKNTFAGPMSSVQADAARHSSSVPLPIFQDVASEPDEDSIPGDEGAAPHSSEGRRSPAEDMSDNIAFARFRHVMTDDGHAVITGRDAVLQRCEDEPIHTPGAVQSFGLLLAIKEESEGCFTVSYTSENSARIIGYTPRQLFQLPNFLNVFTEEQQDNILDHIDFIRDEDADPAINGPEVFSVSIRPPRRKTMKLWCAMHINPAHPDLVICEFELDDDSEYPLRPMDELTPDVPEDTLQSNPTLEELTESTEILSKPLRVLRSARKRRGEAGAMQVFDIMSQVQEQLASAPTLETFLKILVGIVKELTGFHRVMVYQFDSSFNGKVVTELVDTSQTRDLFKGLHFPASDIPKQARDLYKLNKVRLLYDRDLETARLVCRSKKDLDVPLDMSHSYLRAISPIHIKYLSNMAVRSSMSISINAFNELWGLIACHSYGAKGMRVSFPIRKMCRLVGDTASRNIERLSYASRLQARKLINTAPTDKNPTGYIIASSEDLLKLFDADFGMLSIQGETKILGTLEQSQEALAMLEYLRIREITSVVTSQDLREDFPDLRYPPGFTAIAGLLYVPLSVAGNDFIVFFRRGQVKEVKWAGNPYEKHLREGTQAFLEPRKSFKTWHETVLGKCREWTEEQVETAAVLCLVYGKFIEVWRQKEAALQSSRLTRLLLANSAHEVRTPLNAIINYLEIALEGSLDQETRDNLAKSHSASKSLIYVINDLLDLTKTEEGQNLIKAEIFDLSSCLREATDPFLNEAKRKGIDYEIIEHPGLPRFVYGDGRRVRQAISNITANAVQNTVAGSIKVEAYVTQVVERRVCVEVAVSDTGCGMSDKQLDALFRDLEQVDIADLGDVPSSKEKDDKPDDRTLGLGLAMVARIVRNMDGQLRLKSVEGKGSKFVAQLPFNLPDKTPESPDGATPDGSMGSDATVASITQSIPPTAEGEIMLVDGGGPTSGNSNTTLQSQTADTISLGSQKSVASRESGASSRSDADRLIDAIQTPFSLAEGSSGSPVRHRANSMERPGSSSMSTTSSKTASDRRMPISQRETPTSPGPLKLPDGQGHGFAMVRDTKTPIRPIKMPDDYFDKPEQPQYSDNSRILFEVPNTNTEKPPSESGATGTSTTSVPDNTKLQVLIAEDDPINMKILRKRLEKAGHQVHHAVNGEECARMYRENSKNFDLVLMDMQMPIVDGLASTKMIRSLEASTEHQGYSPIAAHNGQIPIFAVSASLVEREKDTYVSAGFNGWILKPVDFKRLNTLLLGIVDDEIRTSCLYTAGEWERGGWFCQRRIRDEKSDEHSGTNSPGPQDGEETPKPEASKAEQNSDGEAHNLEVNEGENDNDGETPRATQEKEQDDTSLSELAPAVQADPAK